MALSDHVAQVVTTIFTLDHLAFFTAGLFTAWMHDAIRARWKHQSLSLSARVVVMCMSLIVLSYVTISTHRANECIVQFNNVMQLRAKANDEDQSISLEQRMELYTLVHDIVFPPAPISDLDVVNPVRQQYISEQFVAADNSLSKGFVQQRANEKERAEHPLPNTTCSG